MTAAGVPVPFPRSRLARRFVSGAAAIVGAVFFRNAVETIHSLGWGAWPLSLLLCVLAAATWQLAIMLVRPSQTVSTHTDDTPHITTGSTASKPDAPS